MMRKSDEQSVALATWTYFWLQQHVSWGLIWVLGRGPGIFLLPGFRVHPTDVPTNHHMWKGALSGGGGGALDTCLCPTLPAVHRKRKDAEALIHSM